MTEDLRAQQAESERVNKAILELVYESISDVIYLLAVEPDDCYRFLSVNRAFFTATGITPEQVIGKRIDEILPPASYELVVEKYRQAIHEQRRVSWEETAGLPGGRKDW